MQALQALQTLQALQALKDNLIVRPILEKTHNKIIIPDSARKYKQYDGHILGKVISIGKDYKYKTDLKEGDKIIFQRHEGVRFSYNGQIYLKLKPRWIYGKYNDQST